MLQNDNILIIDGHRYYYDITLNDLIQLDDFTENNETLENITNIKNQRNLECEVKNYKEYKEYKEEKEDNLENINEWYMENYDIDFWENILSRNLDEEEKEVINEIWNESSLNIDITVLQKNLIKHNCYVKNITNNVGNCLYESLASLGLGDNNLGISQHKMIRKSLSAVLLMVKTEENFFPNINLTPEEIFTNANDIEYVKDKNTGKIYKYDYDMMLYDLNLSFSWERLPTEFILMAISRIYQVEIHIYHNKTNFINKINVLENDKTNEIIRLGLINEEHYLPLSEIPDELKNNPDVIDQILNTKILYDKNIKKFKKWSKNMMDSLTLNSNNITKKNDSNNKIILENDSNEKQIMKNNKLTIEQINDYNEISNIDDFIVL